MGDRGMIHFKEHGEVEAAVYTHWFGSSVDSEMVQFFEYVEDRWGTDTRYDDASYLAARFVGYEMADNETGLGLGIIPPGKGEGPIWVVDCDYLDGKGRPTIKRS